MLSRGSIGTIVGSAADVVFVLGVYHWFGLGPALVVSALLLAAIAYAVEHDEEEESP